MSGASQSETWSLQTGRPGRRPASAAASGPLQEKKRVARGGNILQNIYIAPRRQEYQAGPMSARGAGAAGGVAQPRPNVQPRASRARKPRKGATSTEVKILESLLGFNILKLTPILLIRFDARPFRVARCSPFVCK